MIELPYHESPRTKFFVYNCTHPMIEIIFHKLAYESISFKPCFSSTTHLLPVLGPSGYITVYLGFAPCCHTPVPENHITEEKPAII